MSVKIEWKIFTAETQSDGTWKSNSPSLAELLNAIASSLKIRGPTQDLEFSMAELAIRGLPYFKIAEESPGNSGSSENEMEPIQA